MRQKRSICNLPGEFLIPRRVLILKQQGQILEQMQA